MDVGKEFRKYAIKHQGISSLKVDAYIGNMPQNMTRTVIEERPMNFREIDVFSQHVYVYDAVEVV